MAYVAKLRASLQSVESWLRLWSRTQALIEVGDSVVVAFVADGKLPRGWVPCALCLGPQLLVEDLRLPDVFATKRNSQQVATPAEIQIQTFQTLRKVSLKGIELIDRLLLLAAIAAGGHCLLKSFGSGIGSPNSADEV